MYSLCSLQCNRPVAMGFMIALLAKGGNTHRLAIKSCVKATQCCHCLNYVLWYIRTIILLNCQRSHNWDVVYCVWCLGLQCWVVCMGLSILQSIANVKFVSLSSIPSSLYNSPILLQSLAGSSCAALPLTLV